MIARRTLAVAPGRAPRAVVCLVAVAVAVAVAAATGCRRRASPEAPPAPPRPRLGEVQVVDQTPPTADGAPQVDAARLAESLRRQLLSSGLVVADGAADAASAAAPEAASGAPVLRLAGQVAVETVEVGARGLARASVRLRLTSRPEGAPGAFSEDLAAGGEREYRVQAATDRGAIARELAERTAGDLLGSLIARRRLAIAAPAELHAAIAGDAGAGVRQEAIRQVGARGVKEEAPALLALLSHPDEELRDAALGALVALGDRRAVRELTRGRALGDRREMRKILDAIAALGGDEARDYLGFVAQSHDDEEIRALASEALRRMDRRAAPAAR